MNNIPGENGILFAVVGVFLVLLLMRLGSHRSLGRRLQLLLLGVLLVLAVANPSIESTGWFSSRDVTVLIVDLSRGHAIRVADLLKKEAWPLDPSPDPDELVVVVGVGDEGVLLHRGPWRDCPEEIQAPESSSAGFRRRVRLDPALDVVSGALPPDATARLIVVTDGGFDQDRALVTHGAVLPFPCTSVQVVAARVMPRENAAVRFVTGPLALHPEETTSVEIEISGRVRMARSVALEIGGRRVSPVTLTPLANTHRVSVKVGPVQPKERWIRARINGTEGWDADGRDDVAELPVQVARKSPRLLVVDGNSVRSAEIAALAVSVGLDVDATSVSEATTRMREQAVDVLCLHNVPWSGTPEVLRLAEVATRHVAEGGGLLLAGADRAFGNGGWEETPLERLSPLVSRPGNAGLDVTVCLDRSGSMERGGRYLAACAAVRSIHESLGPEDQLRLLIFGTEVVESHWKGREALEGLKDELRRYPPSGGTHLGAVLDRALAESAREDRDSVVLVLTDGQDPASLTAKSAARWSGLALRGRHVVHVVWFDRQEELRLLLNRLVGSAGRVVEVDDFSRLTRVFLDAVRRRLEIENAVVTTATGRSFELSRLLRTRTRPESSVVMSHDGNTAALAIMSRGAGAVAAAPFDLDGGGILRAWGSGESFRRFMESLAVTGFEGPETILLEEIESGWRYRLRDWSGSPGERLSLVSAEGEFDLVRVGATEFVGPLMSRPPLAGFVLVSGADRRIRRSHGAAVSEETHGITPGIARSRLAGRLEDVRSRGRLPAPTVLWAVLGLIVLGGDVLLRCFRR